MRPIPASGSDAADKLVKREKMGSVLVIPVAASRMSPNLSMLNPGYPITLIGISPSPPPGSRDVG